MADKREFRGHVAVTGRFNHIKDPITAPASTTTTLKAEQSGAAVLLTPVAAIVVLPSASPAGQYYEFVMAGDGSTTECTVKTSTTDNSQFFIGGFATGEGSDHKIVSDGNSNSEVNFHATHAKAGDRFSCVSTGTGWVVTSGFCQHASGVAFADQ